jgi:hypothetical protein
MTKRIEVNGKFYRMRRGKQVEIPSEWIGKTTHPQTIASRKSKSGQGKDWRRKCQR